MTTEVKEDSATHNEVLTVDVRRGVDLANVQKTVRDLGSDIADRIEVVQLGRSPRVRVNVWGIRNQQSTQLNNALLMLAGGLGTSFPIDAPDSEPHHAFYDFEESQEDILELVPDSETQIPEVLARRIGRHATDIMHNLDSWEDELHVPQAMLQALYASHPQAPSIIENAKGEYAAEAQREGYEEFEHNMAILASMNLT